MLDLSNVTVCAADCQVPHLAARALRLCTSVARFAAALLFTDVELEDAAFRTVRIGRLASREDYSRFMLRDLVSHIGTRHVLIVQWDGYIVHPSAWQVSFLDYDYIGARWPMYDDRFLVGNGGFSLRSYRLLDRVREAGIDDPGDVPEDTYLCREKRRFLEERHGIRFAPTEVADRFSYEIALPERPSFGFHGLFNLWRHCSDPEILDVARMLTPAMLAGSDYVELIANLVGQRKFEMVGSLYAMLRDAHGPFGAMDAIRRGFADPGPARWCFNLCEDVFRDSSMRAGPSSTPSAVSNALGC